MPTRVLLATSFALFLTGCGDDGSASGGTQVAYAFEEDNVVCFNQSDRDDFSFDGGSYRSITCTWSCATYEGKGPVYVSLDFVSRDGGPWVLDSEYVSDPIC